MYNQGLFQEVSVRYALLVLTLLGAALAFGDVAAPPPVLHLYASDAAERPLAEAAAAFGAREGVKIELHAMKARAAAEEIKRTGHGDWFIPATAKGLAVATARDLLLGPAETVAYVSLALSVRKGNPKGIRGLDDLLRPDVVFGMGDPADSTVGALGHRVLERAPNGKALLAAAARQGTCCSTTAELVLDGDADVVLGWSFFDSWAPDRIETIPLPEELHEYYPMPAAVLRTTADPARAARFVQFLKGADGQAIFRRHGFAVEPIPGKIERLPSSLPAPNAGSAAFWDGRYAYLLGGEEPAGLSNAILRFDPESGRVERMKAKLPSPRKIVSVAWDGRRAYVFGGCTGPTALTDEIVVYEPAADRAWLATTRLPSPRGRTAAVWAAGAAYVLGGNTGGFLPTGYLDEIVKYDPGADRVEVLPARLPGARASRIAAGWDGAAAWFFGGMVAEGKTDQIVRFDPAAGRCEVVAARLPAAWDGGVVLFDGRAFRLFGGMTAAAPAMDTVWTWVPGAAAVEAPGERLPAARKGQSAVVAGATAYVFGGRTGDVLSADILRCRLPRIANP